MSPTRSSPTPYQLLHQASHFYASITSSITLLCNISIVITGNRLVLLLPIGFNYTALRPAALRCLVKSTEDFFCHGVPFVIKTIRITSKVRLHCNKTCSFRPITILITNQTKPPMTLLVLIVCAKPRLPLTAWREIEFG